MGDHWQHTLAKEVSFRGPGIHSGELVKIRCLPAPPCTGIVFLVKQGGEDRAILANLKNVVRTERCTTLGVDGVELRTVEHLLAAIRGMELDNLFVEVEGSEIPITDGSALVFAKLFAEAGSKRQGERRSCQGVEKVHWVKEGEMVMVLLPAPTLCISYTFVTNHPLIGVQFAEFVIDKKTFLQEIAPARTFGFSKEVESLRRRGLIKGGSVHNALLIGEEEMIGELRFSNELARHKILDILGDMALTLPFTGHIVALRSGHTLDVELVRKIEGSLREERFRGV